MPNENTPKPWERQPGETPKPFEAFCVYRDMGLERSLSKVAAKLSKSETLMGRWSGQYDWVKRAAAWDDEQERVEREAKEKQRLKDIAKMRERHAGIAVTMLVKAATALQVLPPEEIKAQDISRMVDVASKLERISRGDVGDVIEERNGGEAVSPVQIYIPTNNREKKDDFDDLEV
ncbi:MAG: hypothetical protein ACI4PO_03830 [Faecousia sp.]